MSTKLLLDRAGRVVIPKAIREEVAINPGDSLEIECERELMILRPVRCRPGLEKERGVWVYGTGEPLRATVAEETPRAVRGRRTRPGLGRSE